MISGDWEAVEVAPQVVDQIWKQQRGCAGAAEEEELAPVISGVLWCRREAVGKRRKGNCGGRARAEVQAQAGMKTVR